MSEPNVSLEDQFAVLLDSMAETQKMLTNEREERANERAQFIQQIEWERAEFAKTRGELVQALQGAAQQSVSSLVTTAAESLAAKSESSLRARVDLPLLRAKADLSIAAAKGEEAASHLGLLAQDLKGSWKTAIVPSVLVLFFIGWLVVLWAQWGVRDAQREANKAHLETEDWKMTTADLLNEYRRMKAEMEKWKAAGVSRVELFPCTGGGGLCVLVDKKQGAFGERKNLYVPGSLDAPYPND